MFPFLNQVFQSPDWLPINWRDTRFLPRSMAQAIAELEIVMSATAPLQPHERARFLQDVAAELESIAAISAPVW